MLKRSQYMPEDFWQESDGTWTVHVADWHKNPISGIPSKKMAAAIVDAIDEAMKSYGEGDYYD